MVLPTTFFLPHATRYGSSRLVQNNVIHFESLVAGPRQWCDLLAVVFTAAVVLAAAVVFTAAVVLAAAVVFAAAVVSVLSLLWCSVPLLLGSVPLLLCLVP
jgi:hypothetical protein